MSTNNYYNINNFLNSKRALDLEIINYFTKRLFTNKDGVEEPDRIIYSSTDYALRKRSGTAKQFNTLSLPFMNFKGKQSIESERQWFNHSAAAKGVYIPELSKKLKVLPFTIEYDSTFWCHKDLDLNYAYSKLRYDEGLETIIPYMIDVDGLQLKMIGVVAFSVAYEPTYTENDWFERNKIHSIAVNFSVNTMMLFDDGVQVSITEKAILDWAVRSGVNNNTAEQEIIEFFDD